VDFVREYGSWLIYHEPRDIDEPAPDWLRHWNGDGIIARLQNRRMTSAVERTGIPTVDVLGAAPSPGIPLVHVDNVAIARLGAQHLLERGLSSFGFCNMKGVNWSEARRRAFADCVEREGYACSVFHTTGHRAAKWSWEHEQDRMARWLEGLGIPAGVMVCSDWRGLSVLDACRRAGLAVPDDVAIIGVDNDTTLCEACDPPLTSVAVDYRQLGRRAAMRLARMMAGKKTGTDTVLVKPRGVNVRRSTDMLAIREAPVAAAVRFIRDNACKGIRVEDVVERIPMSRSVLQRRFRKVLGRSVHEEIVRIRLEEAMFFLRESELPLARIAERAGFRHQEYMGAVFKKSLGVTPRQYRRQWAPGGA
jgi:LacI family transcriptional regulator